MIRPADERVVADIWERQAFDRTLLAPLGLAVLFRGVPSDAGGPDYQDAVLSPRAGGLIQGDVEFHIRSSDWYAHGHHMDYRYREVVLHVVWEDDAAETRTADGRSVPVLTVGRAVDQPLPSLTHCTDRLAAVPPEALAGRLHLCGRRRFQERRDRFAGGLEALSPDQVVYAALLESLGHAANRRAFAALADAIPYDWLRTIPQDQRAAYLSEAAGLRDAGLDVPGRLPPGVWRLVRLRPANHPLARIAAFATLLPRLEPSPADAVTRLVREAARPADLRRSLLVPGFLGPGRADEIIASCLLPFAAAADDSSPAPRLYERYPAPPSTRWTRIMQDRLGRAGHPIRVHTAMQHQGLHWLYHRHCRFDRAAGCPVCC